jgi:hypothetical protein
MLAAITAAMAVGSVSPDVVAAEARKAAQRHGTQPPPLPVALGGRQVISLPGRHLAGLPADDRPLPSVAAYDDLPGKASS